MGHLCGYIGVPKGHPWYGKDHDMIEANVHGGLTYFGTEKIHFYPSQARLDYLINLSESEPDNGEYDKLPQWDTKERQDPFPHDTGLDIWWLGFDCAHGNDFRSPKNEAFVRAELDGLAHQAAEAIRLTI